MRNRTENQVTLVFIRHGETQANKERRYLGRTDESLSEAGRELLKGYKMQNLYPQVEYLFISPMKRCVETAEILYPALNPIFVSEWTEMDFGRFEYKNYRELKEDARYQAWIDSGGTLAFPKGESRADFVRRCESGWRTMWEILDGELYHQKSLCPNRYPRKEQKRTKPVSIGAIVHGGTIMALLSACGEMRYFDCQAANGKGYICHLSDWGNRARIKEVIPL